VESSCILISRQKKCGLAKSAQQGSWFLGSYFMVLLFRGLPLWYSMMPAGAPPPRFGILHCAMGGVHVHSYSQFQTCALGHDGVLPLVAMCMLCSVHALCRHDTGTCAYLHAFWKLHPSCLECRGVGQGVSCIGAGRFKRRALAGA